MEKKGVPGRKSLHRRGLSPVLASVPGLSSNGSESHHGAQLPLLSTLQVPFNCLNKAMRDSLTSHSSGKQSLLATSTQLATGKLNSLTPEPTD